MPRWRVEIVRAKLVRLGTVEAPDIKTAIEKAAAEFEIEPARRNRLIVTKISTGD